MKKQVFLGISVLLLAMMACSFGNFNLPIDTVKPSGNVERVEKPLSGISQVDFNGLGQLTVEQGEEELLVIEADDNFMPYITTNTTGDRLVIGMEKGVSINSPVTLRFTLMVKDLSALDTSGLGDIKIDGLSTDELAIGISGGGNLDLKGLDTERLTVSLSGLGNVFISGNCRAQKLEISGGGNYDAGDLKSDETQVVISGLGGATVWATESLDVTISGGGDVNYYGNPQVRKDISGLGRVSHRGDK